MHPAYYNRLDHVILTGTNLKQRNLNVDTLSFKTVSANDATVTKEWLVVDATNEVLGRLASKVAKILRGKHKPS